MIDVDSQNQHADYSVYIVGCCKTTDLSKLEVMNSIPTYVFHLLNNIGDYLQTTGQEIISNLSSTFTIIVYWL